jgi:hypothetical protein
MGTERDWVRVVDTQVCDECGLDAASLPREELATQIAHAAASWTLLLDATPASQLRVRLHQRPWSPLEYAGHVVGVLEVFGPRIDRMLAEADPELGWWDHEAAVVDEAYQQADPARVGASLRAAADGLTERLAGLDDEQWGRTGVRRAGERFSVEGLARFAWHEVVHHLHDAADLLAEARTGGVLRTADAILLLRAAPGVPVDISAFSSNTLFGQPGIYPDGPPMSPATGEPLDDAGAHAVLDALLEPEHAARAHQRIEDPDLRQRVPDPSLRAALGLLSGGPADPLLEAFVEGTTPVVRLGIGPTVGEGRVIGAEQDDTDGGRRVLNQRYRAEHPALVAPSLAHALCHHGELASSPEEATLHGLLGAVHTWLLAGTPVLGELRSELARRQASLTITLLNARPPDSTAASIRCPDGPGTIPGGNPALACPDLWSIPFNDRRPQDCDLFVPRPVRDSLARLAAGTAPPVPERYDDALGRWVTDHLGRGVWFGDVVRAVAGLGLGLHGGGPAILGGATRTPPA